SVAATISSALTDPDPTPRRAALERLAANEHGLGDEAVERALQLAIRDRDPAINQLALATLAQIADPAQVAARLGAELASRSERTRARAAAACVGLAERDPARAIEVLEPVLADPAHDVRAAMLPALAT